jgi:hypothetical protein
VWTPRWGGSGRPAAARFQASRHTLSSSRPRVHTPGTTRLSARSPLFPSLQLALLAAAAAAASSPAPLGLYGLSEDNLHLTAHLLSISAATGAITPVGPSLPPQYQVGTQLTALDERRGILYTLVYDFITTHRPYLLGLNLSTGALLSAVPAPFHADPFVGLGELVAWDSLGGRVIVSGQLANLTHVVGFLDPLTGAWDPRASLDAALGDVFSSPACFVPPLNALAFQLRNNLTVDIFLADLSGTGKVTLVNQSYTDARDLGTLEWDPVTGKVYGLGILVRGSGKNATLVRTLSALDPATLTISEVGAVEGYLSEYDGIGAIDVAGRSLWWVGLPTGAGPNAPADLLQLSLDDARVLSAVQSFCDPSQLDTNVSCPYSIEYLNAPPQE